MSAREEMLGRIRGSLRRPDLGSRPSDLSSWPPLGAVMPEIASGDLALRFEDELGKAGGSTHSVRNRAEISDVLTKILNGGRADGVVLSRNPLLGRLRLTTILRSLEVPAWAPPGAQPGDIDVGSEQARQYRDRCFSAAAGITGVDFALAETGSLILTSNTEGSQLSSLAPPIHIAFYLRSQILGTLEEVLQGLAISGAEAASGRSIVFVTGTSRTADIEQILIRGVHGPREMHAILVEESCLPA
jgi:L-lactate utilization protein LutC